MSAEPELPLWASIVVSLFMLGGGAVTLIGALGLARFKSFYDRVHAPTLGATIGTGLVVIGSMICFSVLETRPILHEVLIGVFATITTPVTLILLVRAALYRDRVEQNDVPADE